MERKRWRERDGEKGMEGCRERDGEMERKGWRIENSICKNPTKSLLSLCGVFVGRGSYVHIGYWMLDMVLQPSWQKQTNQLCVFHIYRLQFLYYAT